MDYNNFRIKDIYKTIYSKNINNTLDKSRLDRFYISEHLIIKVDKIKHGIYLSDHKTVELELNMEKVNKWGKGYWKLNNHYLKNKIYPEKNKNEINQMQEDLYENSIDKWKAIKVKIKRKSINYAIN